VQGTVDNTGDYPTFSSSWFDDVYLSDDNYFDIENDFYLGSSLIDEFWQYDPLNPGDNYTNQIEISLPEYYDIGQKYLFYVGNVDMVADPLGLNSQRRMPQKTPWVFPL
jgi:hypothetical protein